jgi:hypothetical protein
MCCENFYSLLPLFAPAETGDTAIASPVGSSVAQWQNGIAGEERAQRRLGHDVNRHGELGVEIPLTNNLLKFT